MWVTALVSSVVTAAQSRIQSFLRQDGRGSSRLSRYWWGGCVFSHNGVTWLVEIVGRTGAGNHRGFKRHTQHCLEDCTHTRTSDVDIHVPSSEGLHTHTFYVLLISEDAWIRFTVLVLDLPPMTCWPQGTFTFDLGQFRCLEVALSKLSRLKGIVQPKILSFLLKIFVHTMEGNVHQNCLATNSLQKLALLNRKEDILKKVYFVFVVVVFCP